MLNPLPDAVLYNKTHGPSRDVNGAFLFNPFGTTLRVIASDGGGWDHVSVSAKYRCPTWEEMCWVKDKFFGPEEPAMQLHPARSQYVNHHPYCLHLWRPQSAADIAKVRERWGAEWVDGDLPSPGEIPLPPKEFVGPTASPS